MADYPYPYPDQTGWGPSTTGNNPSRQDYTRNQAQRAVMDRLMDQGANRDTYIQSLLPSAYRPFASEAERKNPALLRQGAYTSQQGQATRDLLQAGRESGAIGHGSIGRMVHSLAQGAFSGIGATTTENIRQNLGQNADGTTKYGDYVRDGEGKIQTRGRGSETVHGAGAVTEKVASVMQDRMVKSLYGAGTADPEDFYGMAPDKAAELVGGVMRRGGTKKMVNIVEGATGKQRLDAAIDEQGNPMLKNQLQQMRAQMEEKNMSEQDQQAFLNAESVNPALDDTLRKEVGSIGKSTVAVQVLEKGSKDVMNTVKAVAKGVSALKDIYGELASPEMATALTGIDGQSSLKMARRQASVISQVTNAAAVGGIDPKAMFDLIAQLTAKDAQRTQVAYNQNNAGDAPGSATVRASIATQSGIRGAEASAVGKDAQGKAEELGYKNAEVFANDAASVATATQTAMNEVKETRDGATLTKMMMASGDDRVNDEMKDLMAQYEATGSGKDGQAERARLSALMKQNVKVALGVGDMNDQQFADYGQAQNIVETAMGDPTAAKEVVRANILAKVKDQEYGTLRQSLSRAGATGAEGVDNLATDAVTQKLGKLGMLGLQEASKNENVEARKAQMEGILKSAKVTDEEKASVMSMFDENGTIKDEAAFTRMTEDLAIQQKRMGDTSIYAQESAAGKTVAQRKASAQGDYFKTEPGGDYSFSAMIKNIGLGKQKGISSPQEAAHALEAMKTAGISDEKGKSELAALQEQYVTGIDLTKGVDQKTLDRMNKMLGYKDGDGQLAKQLGYDSEEALKKESQTKEGLEKFLTQVDEKTGITMSGDPKNMMMTSEDIVSKYRDAEISKRVTRAGILEKLSPSKGDEKSVGYNQIMQGKEDGDISFGLQADTTYKQGAGESEYKMQYQGAMGQAAENINNMSEDDLVALRKMDPKGDNVKALKAQRDKVAEIMKMDSEAVIVTEGPDGKEKKESATDAQKRFDDAINRLEGAQGDKDKEQKEQTVGTMTVTNLKIENWPKLWG